MAFCSKCGTQVAAETAFCAACGTSMRASEIAHPAQASAQGTRVMDDDAAAIFVGKNYDYFLRKWEIAEKGNNTSWNWAAFFLGALWLAYRKMYLYTAIFLGAVVLESIFEYMVDLSSVISNSINIGIAVVFGLQGNYWYKLHVEKKLKEISETNSPELARAELARQGGTSIGAALGLLVGLIVILGALVFLLASAEN